jgi:subtilisin family serine protease
MKKTVFAVGFSALIVLALTFPFTRATAQKDRRFRALPANNEPFVPGRVLVKFRSNVGLDHARQIVASLGTREADSLSGTGVMVLDLPEQADEAAFAHALTFREDVEFAELDRIVRPADITPNDPWFGSWEWYLTKIGAPAAWSTTTGSPSIIIAILDTGIEGTHPDLQPKLVPGWNIYNNNSDTSDVYGHGTVVAGTAAAASNNSQGVASIAWNCPIMPVRISALDGTATYSAMASGLTWAADHGARVANLSYKASTSATVASAASYFQSKGGVVVAAAGNQATFDSSSDNPNILTVSATDSNDVLTSYSNTGNNIDLAAPGTVFTTYEGGSYGNSGGTSVASPIVAGAAALVLSVKPTMTAAQVQEILKQSADDIGPAGWDTSYGWGRVNVARAVSLAAGPAPADLTPPSVAFASPTDGATVSGNLSIAVSASDNAALSSVTLIIDGVAAATVTSAPYAFTWNTSSVGNGSHALAATAVDASGNTNSVTLSVFVNNVLDTTPPTIKITSPSNGSKVTANVSINVNATDNVAVTKVELYVDGRLQAASTSGPFTIKWNTAKAAKGMHTLSCKAYDAAGNTGLSELVSVTK